MAVRTRLRHTADTVTGTARDLPSFLAGLRDAGLLVRERYSEQSPGEITGYAVALPTSDGEPVWHSGAKRAGVLSLPGLQARCETAPMESVPSRAGLTPPTGRPPA